MSLKSHIELMKARVKYQMTGFKAKTDEAEKFPCSLCEGYEFILGTVTFSSLKTPSQKFVVGVGAPVTGIELIPCPTCSGTGIDRAALIAATQNTLEGAA